MSDNRTIDGNGDAHTNEEVIAKTNDLLNQIQAEEKYLTGRHVEEKQAGPIGEVVYPSEDIMDPLAEYLSRSAHDE